MTSVRRLLVLGGILVIVGCGGGSTPASPTPTPTPAPTPTPGSGASISIPMGSSTLTNAAYVPDSLTVAVGTTVTWTNNDTVAHTATSQNNLWDTGDIEPGAQGKMTFSSGGSFPYYCIFHPGMVGTITVH